MILVAAVVEDDCIISEHPRARETENVLNSPKLSKS